MRSEAGELLQRHPCQIALVDRALHLLRFDYRHSGTRTEDVQQLMVRDIDEL